MNPFPLVLIAEDDVVFRRVLQFTITQAKYRVEVVGDGRAALHRLRQGGIDFLITDQQMPHMQGSDLLTHVREENLLPPRRSILCTAKEKEMDGEQLRNHLQLLAVLSKPFSPAKLRTLIDQGVAEAGGDDATGDSDAHPNEPNRNAESTASPAAHSEPPVRFADSPSADRTPLTPHSIPTTPHPAPIPSSATPS